MDSHYGAVPTHAGADALAHILFIKRERPDIYARTYKFLEPMDYLNLRLTGRFSASYATVFPYLLTDNRNVNDVCYSKRLLKLTGVEREKLPDLVPVDAVLGTICPEVAQSWGLPATTQVVCGTADNQTAALGAGSIDDGCGYISVGTTAWLSCHIPFKKCNLVRSIATMPSAIPGRNIVVAEQGAAGRCLEAVAERWLFADRDFSNPSERAKAYDELFAQAAGVAPGCEGLLFLPWLNGSGPPAANGEVRGGFFNQTLRTTRAQAARAVMEGIAFNLRWLLPHVERFAGKRFDVIAVRGRGGLIRFVVPDLCRHSRPAHPPHRTAADGDRSRGGDSRLPLAGRSPAGRDFGPGPHFGRVSTDPSEPQDVRRAFLGVRGVLQANTGTFHAIEPTTQRRTGELPWPRQLTRLPTVWPT